MVKPRIINSATARREPHTVWNAFVDLIASSNYEELSEVQRAPHLAFWYESEVQNGGHFQFFVNRPSQLIEPTLTALGVLGANNHVPILSEAARRWRSRQFEKPETKEEYISAAVGGEFDDLDREFHDAKPTMIELLQNYLNLKKKEFVLLD